MRGDATFSFSAGSKVNFPTMDEKIIRLCEENNVPSLVQALSTLKNQKVRVFNRLELSSFPGEGLSPGDCLCSS